MLFAALNGFLAVSHGAFAAHGLEAIIPPDLLQTFQTGVEYHMYHALALFGTAVLAFQFPAHRGFRRRRVYQVEKEFRPVLVAFLQAYIFTVLTANFIGMSVHPTH